MKSDSPPVCPVSIPVSENTHFRVINHNASSEQCGPCSEISALRLIMTKESVEEAVVTVGMESESVRTELQTEAADAQKAGGITAGMMCDMETVSRPPGKTDSPSKRKGNVLLV